MSFPSDFLALSISAASHLKTSGHPNVVYGLVKALGRMRPDGSDSRLPVKRMPMGLLEYIIGFYNADTISEVCYTSCNIIKIHNYYRYQDVLMTIVSGLQPCTVALGPNGSSFFVVLCGV